MAAPGAGTPLTVLGILGSLRSGSYNRAPLRAATELTPDGMEIETAELDQIPLYNGDVEARGDPRPVRALKDRIRAADALLIVTPEYNYGISGVLKNALDWASRPPFASPLRAKPVAIMGASPGAAGTARAQEQLRRTLQFPRSRVIEGAGLRVPEAYDKFDERGRLVLVHEPTRRAIERLLRLILEALAERPELIKAA